MCRPSAHDQVFSTMSRKEENTSSWRGEGNDFYLVYLHSPLIVWSRDHGRNWWRQPRPHVAKPKLKVKFFAYQRELTKTTFTTKHSGETLQHIQNSISRGVAHYVPSYFHVKRPYKHSPSFREFQLPAVDTPRSHSTALPTPKIPPNFRSITALNVQPRFILIHHGSWRRCCCRCHRCLQHSLETLFSFLHRP